MKTTDFSDFQLMRYGVEYRFPIKCRKFEFLARPLSSLEILQINEEAAAEISKDPDSKTAGSEARIGNLLAILQLECASRPDVGEHPKVHRGFLQFCTAEELNHMFKQYVEITNRVNPDLEEMPADELRELVEMVKKKQSERSMLTEWSIKQLTAVLWSLRNETLASPEDNSSG